MLGGKYCSAMSRELHKCSTQAKRELRAQNLHHNWRESKIVLRYYIATTTPPTLLLLTATHALGKPAFALSDRIWYPLSITLVVVFSPSSPSLPQNDAVPSQPITPILWTSSLTHLVQPIWLVDSTTHLSTVFRTFCQNTWYNISSTLVRSLFTGGLSFFLRRCGHPSPKHRPFVKLTGI